MLKRFIALILVVSAALAQTTPPSNPQAAPALGSISGVAKDAETGSPLPEVSVYAYVGSKRLAATTDAQGRYKFREVPPGQYSVSAWDRPRNRFASKGKMVSLSAGQGLASVDFYLQADGSISGKVLDENKDPVPGLTIWLIGTEYRLGTTLHVCRERATTDDKGEYRLPGVPSGIAYHVLAKRETWKVDAASDVPANPKARRQVLVPTYYPNSPTIEGAVPLVLRAGENREGVDIRMSKSASYCVEGVLDGGAHPGPVSFQISEQQPSFYAGGGMIGMPPGGTSGPDGKIRICDLHPGEYQLTAYQLGPGVLQPDLEVPIFFGSIPVTIMREDARKISVQPRPRIPLTGQVVWHGKQPEKQPESQVTLWLRPTYRVPWRGETGNSAKSPIPGEFSFPGLLMDSYEVLVSGLSGNLYLKDVTYAGTSVYRKILHLGSAASGTELRVVVGQDGGFVKAKVADKDGNPIPDVNVIVMPRDVGSEPELAAVLVSGQTDQYGSYYSVALAPGRYYVLASTTPTDPSPESVGRLWRGRSNAKEVEINPSGTVQVTLEPGALE